MVSLELSLRCIALPWRGFEEALCYGLVPCCVDAKRRNVHGNGGDLKCKKRDRKRLSGFAKLETLPYL